MKNLVFYPVIIASIGWSCVSLFKMTEFITYLKNEFPECTMANANRDLIFFATMIALSLIQHPVERFG